ncbi:MAG: permease [Bacillota bacterium]
MSNYNNFKLAIYCTAPFMDGISGVEKLEKEFAFFEKYIKPDKVYLETHRGSVDLKRQKMEKIIEFFEDKGIEVSGGITPTIKGINTEKQDRFMNVFCYTDKDMREKIKEISEYSASLFDQFILDDFFFTNCTCSSCIEAKGEKSWEEFRLEKMVEVSENLVINPARKVNSDVDIIIKYPNWNEAYQHNGYNTEKQPEIFDYIYTGTETRDSKYTQQDLPRYASYSLMRWMNNVKEAVNLGGWFDSIDCNYNIGYYLEQAYLTAFAKTKEITLFNFSGLNDTAYIPALGHELKKVDKVIGKLGKPEGIPFYQPHHARGEDHLYDYLGMTGVPLEPVPEFPKTEETILLTEDSTTDKHIMEKIKNHLTQGQAGNLVLTSGFLVEMMGKGIEEITSVRYTDSKIKSNLFAFKTEGCAFSEYHYSNKEISLPVLQYKTNDSWPEIVAIVEDNNFPFLIQDRYGKGKIFILTVPENYADLYHLPKSILTYLRKLISRDLEVYLESEGKVGLFLYDNETLIVESFLPYKTKIKLHIKDKNNIYIKDIISNEKLNSIQSNKDKSIFEVSLAPSSYQSFKIVDKG